MFCMAAPLARGKFRIYIKEKFILAPCSMITIGMIKSFRVNVEFDGDVDDVPTLLIGADKKYKSPGYITVKGHTSST